MCILFRNEITAWTRNGVDVINHSKNSVSHFESYLDYRVLEKTNIQEQLDSAYVREKLKQNEQVQKNRHILQRLIMCIKFCGAFELALRGHDEKQSSDNPGIYVGLINFAAELDSILGIHIKESKVFKGTSKTIQNELLDAMLEIYRIELLKEIKFANFVALEADETTDTSNQQQMVIIIRYVIDGQVYERFWAFIKPAGYSADDLSKTLLAELDVILSSPSEKPKLMA